ncbi:hypothetical protein KL933_004647 [Ogataea haglerorum]|uniref:GDP/GTP exchange factor Sec2 N-terminal domain-containing protein n=1 Tax=Ogataea haglerorum TaxID=1937702 RepID=A0AAN6HZ20_9ASCO|nr:hypothetical protein KL915_003876 [Ogataea haglerorum]KAG7703411.1 hypothetical protein KL914_004796 [Ogataea haglerorum]KAG7703740.1 hypothetical protein KL950_004537 [Ogataea haglerorum]KAG7714414.1 hypothetical protein KL913_004611 [Ogataea haglerorum]KAG7715033.1 hypothetical protein KL949_004426 [Ogataea haglerorum]
MASSNEDIIEQLSLQLLEQTEKNSKLEVNLLNSHQKIQELKRQLVESRKQKEDSDKEVERLSYEMEDLSATLFDEANEKVKEANIVANDFKLRNEKLIETLKDRDTTIEVLNNELRNLKRLIAELEHQDPPQTPPSRVNSELVPDSQFALPKLIKYNGQPIYSPTFNQLRFDLLLFNQFKESLENFQNIRETSFFRHLVSEEIEPVLRLDLSPSVKFFQKKSFISSLFESKVVIEPLSASTELWKAAQAQSAPSSPSLSVKSLNLRMFKYETDRPVAMEARCSLCGEARMGINYARLYVMRVREVEYLLCIACATKLRRTVDLLSRVKNLSQTQDEEEVLRVWCELAELRGRLFYSKLGIWDESDENGLVYGWKNSWLGQQPVQETDNNADETAETEQTPQNVPIADTASDKTVQREDGQDETPDSVSEPVFKEEPEIDLKPQQAAASSGTDDILDNYTNTSDEEFNDAQEAHSVTND